VQLLVELRRLEAEPRELVGPDLLPISLFIRDRVLDDGGLEGLLVEPTIALARLLGRAVVRLRRLVFVALLFIALVFIARRLDLIVECCIFARLSFEVWFRLLGAVE
jgi:hypothetical protein